MRAVSRKDILERKAKREERINRENKIEFDVISETDDQFFHHCYASKDNCAHDDWPPPEIIKFKLTEQEPRKPLDGRTTYFGRQLIEYNIPWKEKQFTNDNVFIDGVIMNCKKRLHNNGSTPRYGKFFINLAIPENVVLKMIGAVGATKGIEAVNIKGQIPFKEKQEIVWITSDTETCNNPPPEIVVHGYVPAHACMIPGLADSSSSSCSSSISGCKMFFNSSILE